MQAGRKRRRVPNSILFVGFLIIVLIVGLILFRSGDVEPTREIDTVEEVIVNGNEGAAEVADWEPEQITLTDVSGGSNTGLASRVVKSGVFIHKIKTDLPAPVEGYFYEGWLVSRSPFRFFSTGKMVTNSSDEYVLEWYGEEGEDYSIYNQVVVTLEPDDGDPSPADHVLEGEF